MFLTKDEPPTAESRRYSGLKVWDAMRSILRGLGQQHQQAIAREYTKVYTRALLATKLFHYNHVSVVA